ncbi:AAA family ATPase [Amylibacter sp. SFDW26]|uniref:AAA family ATPase n=1 Tax=Amylibacter sp. SFDW26 TaxID=2652722 RepID=UPI001261CADF|nr:AAA family ATPase [Amylibacter sp. SFDW26]KAB7615438.1 AAA family ATPase [Amylibacter sp. SFDW26]
MPSHLKKTTSRQKRHSLPSRYRSKKSNSSWSGDQLIYFGLEDVENKLRDIANTIKRTTFEAYTRIGGRTLEELLGGPNIPEQEASQFNIEELKVVLARLGKSGGSAENRITDLIESGKISEKQHGYLRSFLTQLLEVYATGKEQEKAIEDFVSIINSYWENDFDEKSFVFNKENVSTRVENRFTGTTLPLNALSSGEKQIVSIFARLYLNNDKRFIVLIDEPELSLSMDWQQRFLRDILLSPSCDQLIAITHSPFVFDNELDRFAGPLKITNRQQS